jgi:hypothetical protein
MTPRQYHLLLDRRNLKTKHQELLNGILCACVVNFSIGAPKKQVKASDFMPTTRTQRVKKKSKPVIGIHTVRDSNGNITTENVELEPMTKMTNQDRKIAARKVSMLFRSPF